MKKIIQKVTIKGGRLIMKKKQLLLIIFCTFLFISNNRITYYSDEYNSNYYNIDTFKMKPKLLNKFEYYFNNRNNLIVYNNELYIVNSRFYKYEQSINLINQIFEDVQSIYYDEIYIINNNVYLINDGDLYVYDIKRKNSYLKYVSEGSFTHFTISDSYFVRFHLLSSSKPVLYINKIKDNIIQKKSLFYFRVSDKILTKPIVLGNILYVRTKKNLIAYNLELKKKMWEVKIGNLGKYSDRDIITIYNDKIFLLETNSKSEVLISAYNIKNGKLIWSTPFIQYLFDENFQTKIYLYKDNVYVGTWGFDIETGEKILDDKIIIDNKRHRYHEEIACYNGVVYFCLDNGDICAYGLEEKKILWTYHFENDNNIKSIPKMCNGYLYVISKKALYKFGLE